jgi:hypothetical protein
VYIFGYRTRVYTVVSKLGAAALKSAPCLSQGCHEILEASLLLMVSHQTTPMVRGFLCILLQTDYTFLKVTALATKI